MRWGSALRAQKPFAALAVPSIAAGLLLIASQLAFQPAVRPFYLYDARLNNEMKDNTFPDWTAVVPPYAALAVTVGAAEAWLCRRSHGSSTVVLAMTAHFLLDNALALLLTLTVSETTKNIVGRLRPDWLQRCAPEVDVSALGQWTQGQLKCQHSGEEVDDGRKSFPSVRWRSTWPSASWPTPGSWAAPDSWTTGTTWRTCWPAGSSARRWAASPRCAHAR